MKLNSRIMLGGDEEEESLLQEVLEENAPSSSKKKRTKHNNKGIEAMRARRKHLAAHNMFTAVLEDQEDTMNTGPSMTNLMTVFVVVGIGIGLMVLIDRSSLIVTDNNAPGIVNNATNTTTATTPAHVEDQFQFLDLSLAGAMDRSPPVDSNSTEQEQQPQQQQTHAIVPEKVMTKTHSPTAAPIRFPEAHTSRDEEDSDQGSVTYKTRGQLLIGEAREAMVDKWGSWQLDHDGRNFRGDNFYKSYPNRDVPSDQWPKDAWQRHPDYLKEFLKESVALVERAQAAILEEYTSDTNNASLIFELRHFNDTEILTQNFPGKGQYGGSDGGWTTQNSWKGLKRRLLHAIMTEDSFVVAMAGHSAAAGHGNLFQQSYTLQIQWILEAVFSRMGVKHEARNFGMGGLGTSQNGLAAASIYGYDVDFLHWDSGMTENEPHWPDLLARQQIMGGDKVPLFWNMPPTASVPLLEHAGVEIGAIGTGLDGIPIQKSIEEIEKLPWAMQYVHCDSEIHDTCRANEYIGHCWIDRPDMKAPVDQQAEPSGRASWHPGNRKHQVTGRILTMTILQALKEALDEWNSAPGYILDDSAWHLTNHYNKIKDRVAYLKQDQGQCYKTMEEKHGLGFFCNHPFQARTEYTPRHNPKETHIRSLMSGADKVMLPKHIDNAYSPPDIFNPDLHPPKGAIDVLNIVEAGPVPFASILNPDYVTGHYERPDITSTFSDEPGLGIRLDTVSGDVYCDGTIDSFCNRGINNNCLLYGHNDGRNGLDFDAYSGWVLFNIPNIEHGYIVIKMESWHFPEEGSPNAWTSINNKERRELKREPLPFCDDFVFEYMINGKVTSVPYEELKPLMEKGHIARVVETLTLMNDPKFKSDKEVEAGIRILGCGHDKVWRLTHVYWS
ncbi:unnamed protein product [Cylindrotheca closterium]|uniref:Uncharacterized protein n=1 Tax=Cylindrotheca closterium TaxID=2856 RepID=A0AAD2FMU3_9STRA|nr:unnamed protein product [Cylindrotheca closterium]